VSAKLDVLVVGAGVVGLACARELSLRGQRVWLTERHARFGQETSSRNSGVVHTGLHYAPDSWMGRSCVEGRALLYDYCARREIPHLRCGKLVLAVESEEVEALDAMARRGRALGAGELALWGAATLQRHEPTLRAAAALHSPESGLVDAQALMSALMVDLRQAGAEVAFGTRVLRLEAEAQGVRVVAETHGEVSEVLARRVLNAAGHGALALLESMGVDVDAAALRVTPVAGRYFKLDASAPRPKSALVYPLPSAGGLGVHLTRDLAGVLHVGPDAEADCDSLEVPEHLADSFAHAVARYLPGVRPEHLSPDYAGLRPRLRRSDGRRDFELVDGAAHGCPGSWHLLGIESPGLTSSLALARHVADAMSLD